MISDVRNAALLERGAPGREETMESVRKEINDWVARYRRDTAFSGRPSYGNTYSAVNAMAGHLNSFGATAPIPKKRLERLVKVSRGARAGIGGRWRGPASCRQAAPRAAHLCCIPSLFPLPPPGLVRPLSRHLQELDDAERFLGRGR